MSNDNDDKVPAGMIDSKLVTQVLKFVIQLYPGRSNTHGDGQLTILAFAFAEAVRLAGANPRQAVAGIEKALDVTLGKAPPSSMPNSHCLHCRISLQIQRFFDDHIWEDDGDVLGPLLQCAAEYIAGRPTQERARQELLSEAQGMLATLYGEQEKAPSTSTASQEEGGNNGSGTRH